MSGKIKGQHMGRSNGNCGHMRWHTGTSTQSTPETPDLEINALHVSANYNLLQIATLRAPNFISVRNSSLLSPMTYNTKQTPALDCAP